VLPRGHFQTTPLYARCQCGWQAGSGTWKHLSNYPVTSRQKAKPQIDADGRRFLKVSRCTFSAFMNQG
jgi:hypothetical protein